MGVKRYRQIQHISTQRIEWDGFTESDHYDGQYQHYQACNWELRPVDQYNIR